MDLERIPTVGALKLHLQDLVQVTRFRQRILSNSAVLDDRSALVVGDVLFLRLGLCQADEDQVEAFFDAAANGDVFAVEGMLQLPLDPDTWTKNGMALCKASSRGQVDFAQLLLEAGADIDLADKDGTPLMYAASGNPVEVLQVLLECDADTDIRNRNGFTALSMAADAGYAEVVRLLLGANATPDVPCDDGMTAL